MKLKSIFILLIINGILIWIGTFYILQERYSNESVDNKDKILNNEYKSEEYKNSRLLENIIDEIDRSLAVGIEKQLEEIHKQKTENIHNEIEHQEESNDKSDWNTFEATYYTPYCTGCSGITKSGFNVRNTIYYENKRIIAVDPNVIPLHSVVEVKTPYEKFKAVALDIGGAIKDARIDILVSTKSEAYKLGRHDVQLRVIEYGKS